MKHTSVKLSNMPCEIIDVQPFNPLIDKVTIKVCYVGPQPNRNKTVITKDFAKQLANSLPGSPIVGRFNTEAKDFEEHNKMLQIVDDKITFADDTVPYGFVSMDAKCWFQKYLDDESVEREYLVTEGYLWTGQYPESQRVIENGNNHSMELDKEYVRGTWANLDNPNAEFFILNEGIISKLCILGEEYEPCFEGSQITKFEFSLEDDFKNRVFSMMNEIKEMIKGGNSMPEEEKIVTEETQEIKEVAVEEPVAEEPVVEETKVAEEPVVIEEPKVIEEPVAEEPKVVEEPVAEEKPEDKSVKYNLDEIPEYIELVEKYSALETSYNELKEANSGLQASVDSLTQFKANIDKKEKEKLIESFYMLSEEDKKDVKENIDNYSLDEIEAKLSILCVRNKVSFSLEEEKKPENEFSLNIEGLTDDDCVPAWIKAIDSVANKM